MFLTDHEQQFFRLCEGLSKFSFGHWLPFSLIFSLVIVPEHFQSNDVCLCVCFCFLSLIVIEE